MTRPRKDLRGVIMSSIAEHRRVDGAGSREIDPEKDVVLIPRAVLADWLRAKCDRKATNHALTSQLKRARIPELKDLNDMRNGVRFWRWTPHVSASVAGAWRIDIGPVRNPAKWHEFKTASSADVIKLHQESTK